MAASADLTVACVLRSGGIYEPRHVTVLQRQITHFMPGIPFVCLSDVSVPCERIAIERGWPGWWSKIELFDHFKGPTFYLDLDSTLIDDPRPLLGGRFRMIRNWMLPEKMASGVMYWEGDFSHITRAFERIAGGVMCSYTTTERWGDEAFIAEQAGDVEEFPHGIESWRYTLKQSSNPPPGTKIVAFNNDCPPWKGPRWARRWYEPTCTAP